MFHSRVIALLVASASVLGLVACTPSDEPKTPTTDAAATVPHQAILDGEWVVTRTVVSSDDASNPARAVGAESVRYMALVRESCGEPLCAGTVSSGTTLEGRETAAFTQVNGGLEYTMTGAIDCMNAATGGVLAVDAFEYSQKATLTIGEYATVDGVDTATTLTGTILYSDTVTAAAVSVGCARAPATVTVEYAVTATRPA
jgi:hypothetical protein